MANSKGMPPRPGTNASQYPSHAAQPAPHAGQSGYPPEAPAGWPDPYPGHAQHQPTHGYGGYHDPRGAPAPQGWPEPSPAYPQQGGYPDPYHQQYQAAQHPGYPAEGYHYPAAPGGYDDGYAQPTLAPAGYSPAPAYPAAEPQPSPPQAPQYNSPYAPQFDPFVPPSQPPHQPHAGREPQLRGPTFDDWQHRPAEPETAFRGPAGAFGTDPYAANGGGYDPNGGRFAANGYEANGYDPAGYDRQRYPAAPQGADPMANGHHGGAYPGYPGEAHAQAAGAAFSANDWQRNPQQAGHAQAQPYAQQGGYPGQGGGQEMALHPEYDDEEYEDEEPERPARSSRTMVMIGVALVAAIVVGAGMVYGYKLIVGPESQVAGGPPVVRGASEPAKVRPSDPGGRQFEHTDSKIMGRLGEQGAARAEPEADGTRRVPTIVVGRDGAIVAPPVAPTPSAQPPANPVIAVPGLTIVDGFAGRRPPTQEVSAETRPAPQQPIIVRPPAQSPPAAAPSPPPERPKVVARAPAEPAPSPPPRAAPERSTPRAPAPLAATEAPASAANGYVVVLASVPVSGTSRMDALKQFADMQQRFGTMLQNRTPDVREANLGERGRYHRLVVGPPGSRASANELCSSLKTAGYSGCWITAY